MIRIITIIMTIIMIMKNIMNQPTKSQLLIGFEYTQQLFRLLIRLHEVCRAGQQFWLLEWFVIFCNAMLIGAKPRDVCTVPVRLCKQKVFPAEPVEFSLWHDLRWHPESCTSRQIWWSSTVNSWWPTFGQTNQWRIYGITTTKLLEHYEPSRKYAIQWLPGLTFESNG